MYTETRGAAAMGYLSTKPTIIITTRHASGVLNAGVFGAYTNLSPTQVGVAIGTGSHTYANILRDGEFVINVPGADIVKALSVIASSLPETRSEVEEAGLVSRPPVVLSTPGIAECQAAVEFRFDQEMAFGYHSFMVGRAVAGWIRNTALDTDGKIDIFKARVIKDFKYPAPKYVLPGDVVEG